MTTNDSPHIEYGGAAAALEFARWSLDEQLRAIKDIDAKSERAITLAVAIVALFSGVLTFQLDTSDRTVTITAVSSAVLVAFPFTVAVWLFFRAYSAVNLYLGPVGKRLLGISGEQTDARTRQWLAEQILDSVEQNALGVQQKAARSAMLFRAVLLEAGVAGGGAAATALASGLV
ncbi:MAG: hypothetical protein F4X80_06785 [Chloroflexi bacterium]|nr:hypothetical protein [Chloroflexota bacterium]